MKNMIPKLMVAALCLLGSQSLMAQSEGFGDKADDAHRNFAVQTTQDAAYPGGQQALYMDLFQRMRYPEEAKAEKVTGDITVSFYVEADSTTSEGD